MDNPEEVLQALDEFSKMRPSEIPRELEDYLCFVAKTGDPIYQWSLIKPLFREKLVRVMTDFYESCPTLDLATSPNLEHFNYDIMKCNLLELLESFANAPFTVQRICELLTAPRKEYNRVDKFMRAIEKNILVVSTKEPGPAARRNENGDSMVNGSMDEETPSSQPSHEVEMESWVKDCTTTSTPTESSISPLPNVEMTSTVTEKSQKETPSETLSHIEDTEQSQSTRPDMTVSNFIAAAHEMDNSTNLNSSLSNDTIITGSHTQNASGTISDVSTHINEVPDAIMNEDTSSQPSLDSENDENIGTPPKKLQTTFQSKDFIKIESKSSKFYPENGKTEIKSSHDNELLTNVNDNINSIQREDLELKSDDDSKSSCDSNPELAEKRPRVDSETSSIVIEQNEVTENSPVVSDKTEDNSTSESSDSDSNIKLELSSESENSKDESVDAQDEETEDKTVELSPNNASVKPKLIETTEITELNLNSTNDSQISTESESAKENTNEINLTSDNLKIIVEEPTVEEKPTIKSPDKSVKPEENIDSTHTSIIIQEAMDDDAKTSDTTVPDPIPIVEEPSEDVANIENVPVIVEVTEYNDKTVDDSTTQILQQGIDETKETITTTTTTATVENLEVAESKSEVETVILPVECPAEISCPVITEKVELPEDESMEIDNEDSLPVFQQDEPMEQESGEQSRS